MTVAVLGASPKQDRYSNKAVRLLKEYDHTVYPVHPAHESIEDIRTYGTLEEIPDTIDTLTLYVGSRNLNSHFAEIKALHPKRVIFNPGTENSDLQKELDEAQISWIEACTLVLLKTGQFETAGF